MRFFREALRSPAAATAATGPRAIEVQQYWEKRRVQNHLRRLLEALQEHLRLDSDAPSSELARAFDAAARLIGYHPQHYGEAALDEQQLIRTFEELEIWTPELSASDRSEIFAALLCPNLGAARSVLSGMQPFRTALMRSVFCDGLDRVPFNLPDFPVPVHLLGPSFQPRMERFPAQQLLAVTEAVVSVFCLEQCGLNRIKDFFVSGLLSLEEIQTALPRLMPLAAVEAAVTKIIRKAAPMFSPQEWQDLVVTARPDLANSPSSASVGAAALQLPAAHAVPASKAPLAAPETRAVPPASTPLPVPPPLPLTPASSRMLHSVTGPCHIGDGGYSPKEGGDAAGGELSSRSRMRGRFEPVTEPLPSRDIRSEDPVLFQHGFSSASTAALPTAAASLPTAGGGSPPRVVNWGTVGRGGGRAGHQADEGAGERLSWGTRRFQQELQVAQLKGLEADGGQAGIDHLMWISLDLHHECGGPFLAFAFMRCCQHFRGRRAGDVCGH